jgi:hypothetical protein
MKGATTIKRTLTPLYVAERNTRHAFHKAELGDQAAIQAYRDAEYAASTARWTLSQRFGEATVQAVEAEFLPTIFA